MKRRVDDDDSRHHGRRQFAGLGGHADTAAGARMALVTTRLNAGGFAKLTGRVTTITTSGSTVDVLVMDEGIAVNPRRTGLIERLRAAGRIVAVVEYRDGTVIDVVRAVE